MNVTVTTATTTTGNSARVMFFDFSSAFNTIQPHLLVNKLLDINVPCGLIQWTLDYLTNRSQYVKIGQSSTSNVISSSTGAPQGTVLAPFLFTLYTSDCRSQSSKCPLIKFADDTALIGLISKDDDRAFLSQVDSFVNHCDTNYLELNVSKTKEMVIDFRQARSDPQPVDIKGSAVARVETYKYLGIVLNNKLSWGDHVDLIVKKLNSRMYCLRKLNSFHITPEILNVFYTSTIVSVWRYCLVCWGGNVSKREKRRIDSIVRKAERVIGASQPSVDSVYLDLVGGKLEMVWSDTSHPLYGQLRSQLIPRGSGRLGLPYAGTNRHPASFIPKAIKMFNDNVGRQCRTFESGGFTTVSLLCVTLCNQTSDICNMCECMSFPRGSNTVILTYLLTYLLARMRKKKYVRCLVHMHMAVKLCYLIYS